MHDHVRPSRTRCLTFAAASLVVFALALPAVAGELYQWKDANGVTHYSDAPPPDQVQFENRRYRDGSRVASEQAKPEAPAANPQCTTARANLALLQGEGPVGTDQDGDGKPDQELSADQRANQAELAAAAIKVHCAEAPVDTDRART